MPTVSVIVPNYNHAAYLALRLESILTQEFQDFDVLILDDASTDGSREVIERFLGDPRVRVAWNVRNSGSPFCQWNRGMRETRGEYVWIAESDDWADTRFLGRMLERLWANPRAVLAYSQSWRVDATGGILGSLKAHTDPVDAHHWSSDFTTDGKAEVSKYFLHLNPIPNASAVVVKRSAMMSAGPAHEELKLMGDWLMWAAVLAEGDLEFISEPLNYFRQHPGTVRAGLARGARELEETYLVLGWIAARYPVDAGLVEILRGVLFRRWRELMSMPDGWKELEAHRRIHARARDFDPGVNLRLARAFPGLAWRKLLSPGTPGPGAA